MTAPDEASASGDTTSRHAVAEGGAEAIETRRLLPADARGLIEETIDRIPARDEAAAEAAAARHAQLTKPPASLGRLEELAVRLAGIRAQAHPRLAQRLIILAAGDHGVAGPAASERGEGARAVSAYPQAVTAQMVANFLAGGAAINVLADHAGARVRVVDAGVAAETPHHPDLVRLRLGAGTGHIDREPAMSRDLAEQAVAAGIALFEAERAGPGVDIVGLGEMGIGNSTAAAAIVAATTGLPARTVTGRGTGIDDATYAAKLEVVEAALSRHREAAAREPRGADGIGLLASLGGFEIGVLAGGYLGAAAARVPAVVDGVISGAAALIAAELEPRVRDCLVASHRSVEPGHAVTLERLELEPLLDLGLRLGEGSGAALGISLCVAACRVLDEMATFEEAGVSSAASAVPPEA